MKDRKQTGHVSLVVFPSNDRCDYHVWSKIIFYFNDINVYIYIYIHIDFTNVINNIILFIIINLIVKNGERTI